MPEELCSGCGAVGWDLPIIGVTRDRETGEMAAFPVCALCWRDPEHRKVPLKMHFFPRGDAHGAVDAAARNIMVEKPLDES